ncbi:Pentatricopeptide repeat-containing protein At4g18975, chloroplastic [Linum grandiflorum]
MWRSPAVFGVVRRINWLRVEGVRTLSSSYSSTAARQFSDKGKDPCSSEPRYGHQAAFANLDQNGGSTQKRQIGDNISRKERTTFLVRTLMDLKDSKEGIYGALDAWVAWEREFPIGPLKHALLALEKEQQWHRIVQVIKWILSKGQGNTMGTYGQLIRALDKDHRAEEAHIIWTKKVGRDLHSVPWKLCSMMISLYYRNNMLERLIKLFKGMEAFDRKLYDKVIVQRVADAYEMSGMPEEKERVLEKYANVFAVAEKRSARKSRSSLATEKKDAGQCEA